MGIDGTIDHDREAFAGVLVDDFQQLDLMPIDGGVELEVQRPWRVRHYLRHRADVGADPDEAPLAMLGRHPQPFFSPQAADPLVVDRVTVAAQIVRVAAPPPPRIPSGEVAEMGADLILHRGASRRFESLGGTVLTDGLAGPSLRDPELVFKPDQNASGPAPHEAGLGCPIRWVTGADTTGTMTCDGRAVHLVLATETDQLLVVTTLDTKQRGHGRMTSIWYDRVCTDDERRRQLYAGDIHVASPSDPGKAFCCFARELIEEAFDGHDPETAQYSMTVEDYVEILAELKPRFIHHPRSKEFLCALLEARGCDPDLTYFDVPRLRSSTSDDYLTTGIAYAWHPHRDTWYSAPMTQLNFWMPVYPITGQNAMAFHPGYFDRAIDNDSSGYNYYEWNSLYRRAAANNVGTESRPLPRPKEHIDTSETLVLLPPVGGVIEFSGQQLHSSVPNTSGRTRFSIDFRTVHIGDIEAGRSAPNVDAACTGSSIRDFMRARDGAPMPQSIVDRFNDGTEHRGELVYGADLDNEL